MTNLAGKIALVTGAASPRGIGYATAAKLVERGATVVLTDIDAAELERSTMLLNAAEGRAVAMRLDVSREEDWQAVIGAVMRQFGALDILVNNAGRALMRPLTDHAVADFDAMVGVNLKGLFLGCREAVRVMRGSGRPGCSIVNVSSVAGMVGVNGLSVYAATKGAIRLFTKSVALEVAAEGIRCNSVHPGMVETDFFHTTALGDPASSDAIRAAIPMGRLAHPSEIATCIAFLASDDASYVTGTEFTIDGGYSAQ